MKRLRIVLVLMMLYCQAFAVKAPEALIYEVNLNDRADDLFKVKVLVKGLKADNAIYQFAATAPGTYQIMDIGRYVRSFAAFDKRGKEIKTEHISTNQWKMEKPEKVREIRYTIAETWDTPVNEHRIYWMCGTSIENDHVMINGQGVFGYPAGLQKTPLKIRLQYPATWEVGTALDKDAEGYYVASTYDRAVDSPIMLGRLTIAETEVASAKIEVFTYSKTDKIKSAQLLGEMQGMLNAAGKFLKQLPVKRYTFLYHFEDQNWGAWEHSYSSGYVMKEDELSKQLVNRITSIAAHEFFHVVTPLNIHSEVIEQFNFVTPTPSEHLWLYEGVTEWASDLMQLRGGLISIDEFFGELSDKIKVDKSLDTTYSLSKLGLTCFTDEGQKQYYNIYNRGALVAGLLDIRLLELSGGKRGLREVVNELATTYGPNRAFSEKDFFNTFVTMTYPEMGDFINRYIKNTEPLPFTEYYGKLGISYTPFIATDKKVATLGLSFGLSNDKIVLTKLDEQLASAGFQVNDEFVRYNQQTVSLGTAQTIVDQLKALKAGEPYTIVVRRNGKEIPIKAKVLEKADTRQYVFQINPTATAQQVQLREAWLKNL